MNWISFNNYTLKLGTLELPIALLFFWALFLAILITGKCPAGGAGRTRIFSRQEEPVRYWLGCIVIGTMTIYGTFLWNRLFVGSGK